MDSGFSPQVFADMTDALARFTDDELPIAVEEVGSLREFFAAWAAELRAVEP